MSISFRLDGEAMAVDCAPETRLVDILREGLGRTATKLACGIGRCGACLVLKDGQPFNACLLMAWQLQDAEIVTAEGLDSSAVARIVRDALIAENSFQCGYCAPGFSIALIALLTENPEAGEAEIKAGLEGNLCRCTGYHSILRGALRAAEDLRTARKNGDFS